MYTFRSDFFDGFRNSDEAQMVTAASYTSNSQPSDQKIVNSNYIRYVQKCGAPFSGIGFYYFTR